MYDLKNLNLYFDGISGVAVENIDSKAHAVRRNPVVQDNLPSMFDPVGYVDPNKRIKQMQEAGIRIDAWNHALYDFENGEEDDDGYTMPEERSDLDDLEMLSESVRERDRYFNEMYKMYTGALRSQAGGGDQPDAGAAGSPGAEAPQTQVKESGISGSGQSGQN